MNQEGKRGEQSFEQQQTGKTNDQGARGRLTNSKEG
jgi:hypothetical protein